MGESYGLMHLGHMRTIAEPAGQPTGICAWDEAQFVTRHLT